LFNDGNKTPNHLKTTGKTGGIYEINAKNLKQTISAMYIIAQEGKGGDSDENDIEAILSVQKKYPKLKEIFLIADNQSNMRDYSLINKIKIPVHVILCRPNKNNINYQYVNLAFKTNGSIHTIDEEISTLKDKINNNKIKIFNNTWYLKDGELLRIKDQ
jgi:hypothetical protein